MREIQYFPIGAMRQVAPFEAVLDAVKGDTPHGKGAY